MTKTIVFDREPMAIDIAESIIAADLCFVLQRANRVISRGADSALRATGLTVEQTLLLAAIAEAGSPRAGDLSRALGVDASTMAANLKPLVRQQWVSAEADVVDRRARKLCLTKTGTELLEKGIKQLQEYESDLAAEGGRKTDLNGLCRALSVLAEACA